MPSSPAVAQIRAARPQDGPAIFALIQALAEYEQLSHQVTGSLEDLTQGLFGERPYAQAIVAEVGGRTVAMAIFFYNFSTFLMKPGLYLEDLFVLPEYRRQGIGQALLTYLGKLALEQGCGRLEWSVLDWNTPAIQFYQQLGAELKPEWQLCRVTGAALEAFAQP
jgi:GNAT superfamily N-acetyltransferase